MEEIFVCVCIFFNVHDFVSVSIVLGTNLVVHNTPPKNKPLLLLGLSPFTLSSNQSYH